MKTIIDAVNELKGDLGNLANSESNTTGDFIWFSDGDYETAYYDGNQGFSTRLRLDSWCKVCTIEEFNAMVAEMSEGFEEYKREYEMGKVEAVTVDGMVYELGKLYEFQHDDEEETWHAGILEAVREHEYLRFESTAEYFYKIRECQSRIGTITPAPVELADGKAYTYFELMA